MHREALIAALKPFAFFADPNNRVPADTAVSQGSPLAKRQLTMGDLYAAREVYNALVAGSDLVCLECGGDLTGPTCGACNAADAPPAAGFEVEVDLAAGPSGPVTEAWKTFRTPVLPHVNTAMELDGEKFAIHATRFQFNEGRARIGLLVTRIGSVLAVSASALDRLNNLGAPK